MIEKSKSVWWSPVGEQGLEHLRLEQSEQGVAAKSSILRIQDGDAFQIEYEIHCDEEWRVREIAVGLHSGVERQIRLSSDGAGNWTDKTGKNLPEFAGCFEVDISATPFTNTLPIRRTNLAVGEAVEISVVYFLVPELKIQRSFQRYVRLSENLFTFEEKGLFDGFSAELKVDAEKLVIDYPDLFKRIK